jgi:hypothetical protein
MPSNVAEVWAVSEDTSVNIVVGAQVGAEDAGEWSAEQCVAPKNSPSRDMVEDRDWKTRYSAQENVGEEE